MNGPTNERHERVYRVLVLLHVAVLFVALIVALAVSRSAARSEPDPNRSTFERVTPHIDNWPGHRRPFPRG